MRTSSWALWAEDKDQFICIVPGDSPPGSVAGVLVAAGPHVGHVHFADSNRRAAGMGHTDFAPVVKALREIGYAGYLSAEVLPLPNSTAAAKQTIESFRRHIS